MTGGECDGFVEKEQVGVVVRCPLRRVAVFELEQAGDPAAIGAAVLRIARDRTYREELGQRSVRAQAKFFSWSAIANRFIDAMGIKA